MFFNSFFLIFGIFFWTSLAEQKFPDSFKFGVATSAYQVEGAWNKDGRGTSIWDDFSHQGLTVDNSTGDIAANSYELYKTDIQMLKHLGVNFYRFSISWPRILPYGDTSLINSKGLQYYDQLIDELLRNGIEPHVTIYHWDMPSVLQNLGGLANELIVNYFVDYANVLFDRYADRVKHWFTFNEPILICEHGYGDSSKAPLVRAPGVGEYLCGRNILLANAAIYDLYKNNYGHFGGKIGFVVDSPRFLPKNPDNVDDVMASKKAMEFHTGWFLRPLLSESGGYPQVLIETIGNKSNLEGRAWSRLPELNNNLREFIRGKLDFIGLNYYYTSLVEHHMYNPPRTSFIGDQDSIHERVTYYQNGLRDVLNWLKNEFNNPEVLITENGLDDDGGDTFLNDIKRINFLKTNIGQVLNALVEDKCNVVGYTFWSLMDNFEWNYGYTKKFGLYYVDFNSDNRERKPRASVDVYKKIIATKEIPN